jgi:hypothetical protein
LLTLQWFLVGTCALVAFVAILWARRISTRLERLTQSYWELRYEHGQLSARLARLEPSNETDAGSEGQGPTGPQAPASTAFVPLSSLRK